MPAQPKPKPQPLPRRASLYRDRFTHRLYLLIGQATKAGNLSPNRSIPDIAVYLDLLTREIVYTASLDPERRFVMVEDAAEEKRHKREQSQDDAAHKAMYPEG